MMRRGTHKNHVAHSETGSLKHRIHAVERQIHLSGRVFRNSPRRRIAARHGGNKQTIVGQHSRTVALGRRGIRLGHWLLSLKIPNRDSIDLYFFLLRQPGNAKHCTCRRALRKIVGEDMVQLEVLIHVSKVDLNVNNMSHGEVCCPDHAVYVIESLSDLVRESCGSAAVQTERSLAGNIYVISRVDSRRS